MHDTAWDLGQRFIKNYVKHDTDNEKIFVDIGSSDLNGTGTLRDFIPTNVRYLGLDFEKIANVDIILGCVRVKCGHWPK